MLKVAATPAEESARMAEDVAIETDPEISVDGCREVVTPGAEC